MRKSRLIDVTGKEVSIRTAKPSVAQKIAASAAGRQHGAGDAASDATPSPTPSQGSCSDPVHTGCVARHVSKQIRIAVVNATRDACTYVRLGLECTYRTVSLKTHFFAPNSDIKRMGVSFLHEYVLLLKMHLMAVLLFLNIFRFLRFKGRNNNFAEKETLYSLMSKKKEEVFKLNKEENNLSKTLNKDTDEID